MTAEPTVYRPQPLPTAPAPTPQAAAVVLPAQPMTVAYVPTERGMVAAYVPAPAPAEQPPARTAPLAHPLLVNALLGAGVFALTSLGLYLLGSFIEALAHLVESLVILAAIVCGAPVAVQLLRALGGGSGESHQTVINARRVKVGRIVNRSR
jgi:hypothetical protein